MLKMLKKLSHEEREAINILECNSGTARHTVQRIFCHMELDVDLVRQTLVETTQQRASTTQIDTVLDDVGIKLRGVFSNADNTAFSIFATVLSRQWAIS